MLRLAAAAASAALLIASPLWAWTSVDGYRIEPQGEGRFEVKARPGLSASEAWCAASSYAAQRLGLPQHTRIWRATALPRRAGQGIGFALQPQEGVSRTGLLQLGPDDGSLSIAVAQQFCWSHRNLLD